MKQPFSIAEAKAQFAEVIKRAERDGPVVVTRYGTPVAVIVNIAEYEDLRRTRAAVASGGLASIADGWSGSGELADDLERLQRGQRPSAPRHAQLGRLA